MVNCQCQCRKLSRFHCVFLLEKPHGKSQKKKKTNDFAFGKDAILEFRCKTSRRIQKSNKFKTTKLLFDHFKIYIRVHLSFYA